MIKITIKSMNPKTFPAWRGQMWQLFHPNLCEFLNPGHPVITACFLLDGYWRQIPGFTSWIRQTERFSDDILFRKGQLSANSVLPGVVQIV